jgi:hypothetical protein
MLPHLPMQAPTRAGCKWTWRIGSRRSSTGGRSSAWQGICNASIMHDRPRTPCCPRTSEAKRALRPPTTSATRPSSADATFWRRRRSHRQYRGHDKATGDAQHCNDERVRHRSRRRMHARHRIENATNHGHSERRTNLQGRIHDARNHAGAARRSPIDYTAHERRQRPSLSEADQPQRSAH